MFSSQTFESMFYEVKEIQSIASPQNSSKQSAQYLLRLQQSPEDLVKISRDDEDFLTNDQLQKFNDKNKRDNGTKEFFQFALGKSIEDQKDTSSEREKITVEKIHHVDPLAKTNEEVIDQLEQFISTNWNIVKNIRKNDDEKARLYRDQEFVIFLFSNIKVFRSTENYQLLLQIYKDPQLDKLIPHTSWWMKTYFLDHPEPNLNDFWKSYMDSLFKLRLWNISSKDEEEVKAEPVGHRQQILEKLQNISEFWEKVCVDREWIKKEHLESKDKSKSLHSKYLLSPTDKLFKELILNELAHVFDEDIYHFNDFLQDNAAKAMKQIQDFIEDYLKKETINLRSFQKEFAQFLLHYKDNSSKPVLEQKVVQERKEAPLPAVFRRKVPPLAMIEPPRDPLPRIEPPLTWMQRLWNFLRNIFSFRSVSAPEVEQKPAHAPPKTSIMNSLVNVLRTLGCCRRNPDLAEYEPWTPTSGSRDFFSRSDLPKPGKVQEKEFKLTM